MMKRQPHPRSVQRQNDPHFIRVSRHRPCPVCARDHGGYYIWGMTAVVCMRVASDRMTRCGQGWIHLLKANSYRSTDVHQDAGPPSDRSVCGAQTGRDHATPQMLNAVYRTLFSRLSLSGSHRRNLLARGLTETDIRRLGYRSLPHGPERLPLVNQLTHCYGHKLLTIPGFYLTRKRRIWLAGSAGMVIPCRDQEGYIVGAQIRVDDVPGRGKYRWLSASPRQRRRGGVSSGAPLHIAGAAFDATRLWVTEGILKADIAALWLGEPVIGVAGWKPTELQDTLIVLHPAEVIVAFDADAQTNRQVRHAKTKLCRAILDMGYRVAVAEWEIEKGKGIDDLLAAGHFPGVTDDEL